MSGNLEDLKTELRGAMPPELSDALREIILTIISEHLWAAHGAVILADLRALGGVPEKIWNWIGSLPRPEPDPYEEYHRGG